jgi:hypothetical protein
MDLDSMKCLAMATSGAHGAVAAGDLLQLLGTAAIQIDGDGKVVNLNAAARDCLGDALQIRNRRLFTDDPAAQRALTMLVGVGRDECKTRACTGDQVVIARPNTRPLILRIIRLDDRAAALLHPARAIVVVLDVARVTLPTEAQLAGAFALSCGEARLAIRLAGGQTLEAAAGLCGISYETARKRLKVVFEKTETCRQSDLVALIIRVGTLAGTASVVAADTTSQRPRPTLINGRSPPARRPNRDAGQDAGRNASQTLSVSARRFAGTVRPSVFAVVMLIASSNVASRRTGRSAGFCPLRIRPT